MGRDIDDHTYQNTNVNKHTCTDQEPVDRIEEVEESDEMDQTGKMDQTGCTIMSEEDVVFSRHSVPILNTK